MKHRVFVALPISEKLQQVILDWEKDFADLPVRWLAGKNLHITLVPPWYIEDQELEKLEGILQGVAGFGEFKISFRRVTFGPDPRRPRLIWAEGETPEGLLELYKKIHEVLGREEEKRPFQLHLTIARFQPENFSSFPIQRLDEKVDWRDKVDRVVLFESRLSREGADYKVITEATL
ncbi:MAG: RNA 2',3'-cyclic phosphodiesterase [Candidatus Colwellbacteria bacterium]|nr:RNA 2',3'-cyclic phosphodiesterase [Candidatus Colwellbacteria bacterium]